jgi:hypothetical protein
MYGQLNNRIWNMAFQKKISSIQDRLLDCFGMENPNFKFLFLLNLLTKDWQEIIGNPLCNFTRPGFIKNKILYVNCKHNGIIQTLNFKADEILKIINDKKYGYVFNGIKFVPYSNKFNKDT